jgi:hypothetical protein
MLLFAAAEFYNIKLSMKQVASMRASYLSLQKLAPGRAKRLLL